MEMDAENAAADKLAAMESALCSAAPKADPDAYPSNALGPEEEDGDVELLPPPRRSLMEAGINSAYRM